MSTNTSIADNPNLQTTFAHTAESLEYCVTHVFFPAQLPDSDDYTPENNHSLARAVCAAAHAYGTYVHETTEQDRWHRITKMLDNLQASVQSEDIDGDQVISQLRGMQAGDILAFFIRRQNAAIILTRREDSVLCEAFEVSPSNDAVEETEGPLSRSYPGSAAEIPSEVLDDRDFQLEFASFLSRTNIVALDIPLLPPAHTRYINILLDSVLQSTGRGVNIARVTECGALHKRIRDHVGRPWMIEPYDGAKGVWRRSALWLLVRVIIQMTTNRSPGYASYKRFMLFFMCTLASDARNTSLSSDLLHLMSSRIPQRLSKPDCSAPDWLSDMALETCDRLRDILADRWKQLRVRPSPFRNPSQDELTRDTQASLLNSREYIQNVLENAGREAIPTPFHPSHRRRGTIEDFLSSNGSFFDEAYDADPDATLYDVQQSVEHGIDDWLSCVTNVDEACGRLGILLNKYMAKAYEGLARQLDPEDISIRLLTAVELYVALDKLVVKEIPMLADYSPGISTAFLENLLLRKATSLHRLSCAYQYLFARHSRSRPGWSVLSDEFTENSFPARYYDQSPHLQQFKARIEGDTMKNIIGRIGSQCGGNGLTHTHDGYTEHQQHIPPQQLAGSENIEISQSPPVAKVIAFELQCPACVRIWRSAAPCILNGCYLLTADNRMLDAEEGYYLLANVPALQPYFATKCQWPALRVQIHLAYYYPENSGSPTLRYVVQHPHRRKISPRLSIRIQQAGRFCRDWDLSFDLGYRVEFSDRLEKYGNFTSHTSNDVLATLPDCPPDLSVDEFIVFAHLRSGGSLQWPNVLRGLRCRTLNLRRREVHYLVAHAALQVGPLDPDTGTWIWHQELLDSSFCNILLDELQSLFADVGAGSIDGVLMNSISLLLTRILTSSPSEDITERVIALLRGVRRKTFGWVQELSYDLSKAPTNVERRDLLLDVTTACRSTFDVDPTTFRELFRSAEDVDAFLSCVFFIHALCSSVEDALNPFYQRLLFRRDSRLSFALEQVLKDTILADPSDYGIDFAVGRIFASYSPGIWRWEQLQHPNAHWLMCETQATVDQPLGTVHINLLNGALHVDGQSFGGSLCGRYPGYEKIFHNQCFILVSSNLPGMKFMTLEHKVHFSMRDDDLVVQAQGSQTHEIFELIPSWKLQDDLPPALVNGHVHWLNLSTKIIEIRPFKQTWDESSEHWRIDCAPRQHRVYKGCESLVDTRSPTWAMVLKCFECLNNVDASFDEPSNKQSLSKDLLVTTSLVPSASISGLSITLPAYGLSFFVNEGGELESHDFKDMVYDENQSIGTLFSLENLLVLRPKTHIAGTLAPKEFIHRRVLIPNGHPTSHNGNQVRIDIWSSGYRAVDVEYHHEPLYHTYAVDTELGRLIGSCSLTSIVFLASLHAMTSHHQPDPLTGKTGAQAALHLLQSGACRSVVKLRADALALKLDSLFPSWTLTQHPLSQVSATIREIQNRHYWNRDSFWREEVSGQEKHNTSWIPSGDTGPGLREDHGNYSDLTMRSTTESGISTLPLTELSPRSTKETLDYLICNRRAPEPPARIILHRVNLTSRTSAGDTIPELDPLFKSCSLRTDSAFQQEYIAHLDASAQHVCAESSRMTYRVGGENVVEELKEHYLQCRGNYLCFLDILKESLGPSNDQHEQTLALEKSDQWPPVTAAELLRYLASTSPVEIPLHWKKCLIQLALVLLDLQRARRLLRFALDGLEEEFSKELETEGCDGWKAEDYPDWLLIQIQGNFLIRRAQAETAMQIMSPRSGKNTVMQVNMGDGKSSVIIPIAAAALADGNQLVRVIVPKALTTQMFDLLVARLGGLTNRPIYYLPFSRTPEYDGQGRVISLQIDDLHKLMSRCMAERGILLAQPEHVVSLKLMGIEEQIREGKFATDLLTQDEGSTFKHVTAALSPSSGDSHVNSMFRLLKRLPTCHSSVKHNARADNGDAHGASGSASEWLKLQKWLYSHVRDILDESDEILHARFQLVYTMGPQQHIDGYPDRWTITQRILRLVKKHIHSLSRYHPDSVECENNSPGSFPHVRIVRQAPEVGQRLISSIVEDVMSGKLPNFSFQDVPPALRDAIRSFISDANVLQVPATAKKVEEYAKCSDQSHLWSGLLLLRGLLTSDILLFALTERRWRVDYGPDLAYLEDPRTMLAVPYRAKDMPAPDTQFGHPDLTIVLTCLSYYYAGLSKEQLRASFEILLDQDNPTTEYTLWTQDCESVPGSLLKLNDINLRSSEQWDKVIFPLFSTNQATIDFYLSRVVFPKEAKEFPWKISGSSWDLAEEREKLITGFSGTNDGQWLLPMSIAQRDLDHQKGTNARVLGYLLQSENNSYMVIRDSEKPRSTHTLLQMVAELQPEIRVLLDVGSQILDLSNWEVAKAWLKISPDTAGAIYFDENDELMVLTRNGKRMPALSSSYALRLDRCVIYLDHAHTRGTDIKLPIGSRAAVTLGLKVTKDALVQGCMRMRKLGHGHSVMFFAPPEVDHNIRAVVGKTNPDTQVTTVDILCWAIRETWSDIQQRAPYWAQQGMSHKSRYNAWSQFTEGKLTRKKLTDAWLQPELKSLGNLYAPRETTHPSSTLSTLDPEILQRCKHLGVQLSLPKARIDEEQEREVHREREREREVELPPKAEALQHSVHPDVEKLVKTGIVPQLHSGSSLQPVFAMLGKSSAATCDADVWSPRVLATLDFRETIKPDSTQGTIDQYLRPVQWILTSKKERDPVLVLLSPFEANHFMPVIRASENVHLHVYGPRTSERMKPSDDLKFYSIPPLPSDWTPPWDLIDQLNVFAGQLYLRDYESYTRLCRFLDVEDTTVQRNLFNIPGGFEEMAIMFSGSPLPSVMKLLAIRSRGRPFTHTHMGRILQGQSLSRNDFEESTSDASDESHAAYDRQTPRASDVRIAPLPSDTVEFDAHDERGSSVLLQSHKRGLETDEISEGDLKSPQERLCMNQQ